jgi:tRNA nucleotidyltransferase (CCA-adding enzyme)
LKTYVVGGAVRDELLGLPVSDRDWVVVGATPEEMLEAGYRPVGSDFPVFLHPGTHEEYALARTERKSGPGYKGFSVYSAPDVTLEDDLRRRDLTINAMARDESGRLVDPHGGERDLRAGILRHVGEAFVEDPVRILRVARFAARYGFKVADETRALLSQMVREGEADHLVPERVWQEFSRGLCERDPSAMLEVLAACGLLERILPGLDLDQGLRSGLERAVQANAGLAVRFAVLTWRLDESALRALTERLRPPNEVAELALACARSRQGVDEAHESAPAALLATLKAADAFRRGERFAGLLAAANLAVASAKIERGTQRLARALAAARTVDAGSLAREAASSAEIPARLDAARERAIADALAGP